jgi:acetyl esterase
VQHHFNPIDSMKAPAILRASATVLLAASFAVCAADVPKADKAKKREPRADADTSQVRPGREPDRSMVFKKTPQGELKMVCYFPKDWKADDQRPAIVFWFGGGFARGSTAQFHAKAEYLASRGLVCVCAEYRVKDAHGTNIDSCAEDARSAMRWVKGHAKELGIDPGKVIASGGSAGGTLSLLVALGSAPDAADDDTKISPRPSALVLYNPAQGEPVMSRIFGKGEARERVVRQIEPLNSPQKDMPPAIFFFGTGDRMLDTSREFCEKSIALGNHSELWIADGQGHGFFNRQPWHDATLRKTDEFLTALGYLKGEPAIKVPAGATLKKALPR